MSFMNHCGGFGEGLYQLTVCVCVCVCELLFIRVEFEPWFRVTENVTMQIKMHFYTLQHNLID